MEEQGKNWFDRYMEKHIFERLQNKNRLYIRSSTASKWGFVGLFSTIFMSIIAIAIALAALYFTDEENCIMQGVAIFALVIGILGLLGLAVLSCIAIYFMRNQITEDPISIELKGIKGELHDGFQTINSTLQDTNIKIDELKTELKKDISDLREDIKDSRRMGSP
ncbi:MAG: hypothetical protein WC389_19800 [Lutibacter sp.]|jgi:membrane-anchored glycerophosphoryl diester phosphodiesterase (GDPDase)